MASKVKVDVDNFITKAINYTETYVKKICSGFHIDDFDFPTIPVDFDVDVPSIPQCDLSFQFDGLELYMEINTNLSSGATYTLNLYTSPSAIGFAVGDELLVGVIFSVDLILSVETEIDISSGFHIQLKTMESSSTSRCSTTTSRA